MIEASDVIGWVGGTAGLVGAAASAWIAVNNARHKNRLEELSQTHDDRERIIARLEQQLDKQQTQIDRLLEAATAARDAHADCEKRFESTLVYLASQHAYAVRVAKLMKDAGRDIGDPPPMPDIAPRAVSSDFQLRTVQQEAKLTQALTDAARRKA